MKYYLIAGEASGDLHGSNLIKAIRKRDPDCSIRFWGGDKMAKVGGIQVKHYRDTAFMGFVEVIKHLGTIFKLLRFCKSDIEAFNPDALILIDYPGFNMRIAKWAFTKWPVFYYIAPQVWAWKSHRTHKLKATTNRLYSILPFEKAFFEHYDFDVQYVGHPLLDAIEDFKSQWNAANIKHNVRNKTIALLPGSRKQEIEKNLPLLVELAKRNRDKRFVIGALSSVRTNVYSELIADSSIELMTDKPYELLSISDAAIVASGTATLETALLDIPQVVIYKGNPISVWLGRRIIKVNYISLVNIILDRPLISEFIQSDANVDNLHNELTHLLGDKGKELRAGYGELRENLRSSSSPSMEVANDILQHLRP